MDFKTGIGKPGLALAAIIALAMCVLSLLFHPVEIAHIPYGLCLPSPDSWEINPFRSWAINTVLIGIIACLLLLVNRSYNFIRTTEPALPALFLVFVAASPWCNQSVNTSVLLCLANVVCLGIIFNSYDTRNATQEMFIMGVVAGIGSMFQYAFLPMAFVYFLWSLFMKVMRIKETLAFVAGLLCPYWISLGAGWLSFSDFRFPSITPLFTVAGDYADFLLLLGQIGIAAALGFIITLFNSLRLYAGNSKVNAMNLCTTVLGIAAIVCIVVDFDNLQAYTATLFMATAVQLANICAIWNPKMPWLVTVVPSLLFVLLFAASLVL